MHFCILQNFILRMSWVVKNVSFELNFWHESKFLDFAKFYPSKVMQERSNSRFQAKFSMRLKISSFAVLEVVVKKSHFWVKFSTQINIFMDFVKFHPLLVLSGQNSHNLSQIFNVTKNFWILPNFILQVCMSWVVKNLNFGQKFSTWLKISGFCQISSFAGQALPPCQKSLEPNFQQCSKFLDFTKFYPFAGPEWSKLSILSQIFNASQKF